MCPANYKENQKPLYELVCCDEWILSVNPEKLCDTCGNRMLINEDGISPKLEEKPKHRRYCGKNNMRCLVYHPDGICPDVRDCEACKEERV